MVLRLATADVGLGREKSRNCLMDDDDDWVSIWFVVSHKYLTEMVALLDVHAIVQG